MTNYEDDAGYSYDPTQPAEANEQAEYPGNLPQLSTLSLLRLYQKLGGHVWMMEGNLIFTAIRRDRARLATALRKRPDLETELLIDERLKEAEELAAAGEHAKTSGREYTF